MAARFVEDGWSVKRLIRRIVLSRTYQLSSASDAKCHEVDPAGELLWRMTPRRLDAEALRDAMLSASGQLDLNAPDGSEFVGGEIGVGGRGLSTERIAQQSIHRSVYLPIVRGAVPEVLRVFDFPEPSNIAPAREVTTVPTQALFMLNNPLVVEQSQKMAERLAQEKNATANDRIRRAFQLALSRDPSPVELRRCATFVREAQSALARKQTPPSARRQTAPGGQENAAMAALCQALFASAEFRYLD
jgi:hypothetical protein